MGTGSEAAGHRGSGPDEVELGQRQTAWVRGATDTKMGRAILTSERLLFLDEKFAGGIAGGAIGTPIAEGVQKRHEHGRPLLDLPLASITRITHETRLLSRDRLAVSTSERTYLFADGWKDWAPLLRDTLITRHGRRVVEESADAWRVEES